MTELLNCENWRSGWSEMWKFNQVPKLIIVSSHYVQQFRFDLTVIGLMALTASTGSSHEVCDIQNQVDRGPQATILSINA